MVRRPDIDTLLYAIIGEAEVALRRMKFEEQIEHIQCIADLIRNRMRDWTLRQQWSEIDCLMEEAKRDDPFGTWGVGGRDLRYRAAKNGASEHKTQR